MELPVQAMAHCRGRKVFCSDMTFDATVNPIAYEGGEAVLLIQNTIPEYESGSFKRSI